MLVGLTMELKLKLIKNLIRWGVTVSALVFVMFTGRAEGVVGIDSVETDIGGGLVILPDELKDRSVNLAECCALQLQGDVSSFFINDQGGLPVCPGKTTSRKPFIGNEARNSSGFVLFETRSI